MKRKKKKIIFSSYDDIGNPFYAGGGAMAVHHIASKLASSFTITVITGNYKRAKNRMIDGVQYKRIGPSFFGPKLSQLIFSFLLPFYVMKESFDIWIESFTPPFSTSCLQLFTKKPVIGLVHMLSGQDMHRKYKLPFHRFEEKGLTTYNYFIVVRESAGKFIEQVNKKARIFIIPNGVDFKKNSKSKKQNYILFIGRLEYNQKGLDVLIDAYQHISEKITAKLIIAGSGTAKDEMLLKEKIKTYKLEDRVVLIGKAEGAEKDALFRGCSLVVIPSRYETFSLVALEAMSYGKPIVSFAIRGLDWLPKNCVIQVPPFDRKQFGEAMYQVLSDSSIWKKMAMAGQKIVKKYSWESVVAKYKQAISKVILER